MASSEPAYICPTMGLGPQSRGRLVTNMQNIGGRLLFMEEMNGHKSRLRDIKPAVQIKAPWGYQEVKPTKGPSGGRKRRAGSASSKGRRGEGAVPQRPATAPRHREAEPPIDSGRGPPPGSAANPHAFAQEMGFNPNTELNDEQRKVYAQFLDVVMIPLARERGKKCVEHLWKESSDLKLLRSYTGIFPSLESDSESEDEGTIVPSSTVESEQSSQKDTTTAPSASEAASPTTNPETTTAPSTTAPTGTTTSGSSEAS